MELLSRFELLYVTASQPTYSWIEYGLRPEVSSSPEKRKNHRRLTVVNGAVKQIRTADLVITNDVLYLLSYNSIMATEKGLEPSTSSVTG